MADWFASTDGEALDRLLIEWPDAPEERPETLAMLLDVARIAVIAYAIGIPDGDDDPALFLDLTLVDDEGEEITDIPSRLVYAQLKHAENLWNAGRVSSQGDMGMDSFTFTPRPLDKTIREMIRPKTVPSVV
jgi:hypothetical protein